MTAPPSPDAPPPADQIELALERTYLAYERTLMAWIRTATSLIAFGFTLFKFFEYLREEQNGSERMHLFGPRFYGLLMILIGVVTLALASWQHHQRIKRFRALYPQAPYSLSLVVAAMISVLGILALLATAFQ